MILITAAKVKAKVNLGKAVPKASLNPNALLRNILA